MKKKTRQKHVWKRKFKDSGFIIWQKKILILSMGWLPEKSHTVKTKEHL